MATAAVRRLARTTLRGSCCFAGAGGSRGARRDLAISASSTLRRGAPGGPDEPSRGVAGQPPWPASDWHDHLQYHFFFEGLFVQARVFLTPSLEETSLWIFDHEEGRVEELFNSSERLQQKADAKWLDVENSSMRIQDGPDGGRLVFSGSSDRLELDFENSNTFSWLPAGHTKDAVIHRPDLLLKLKFRGRELAGRGYSKRYFGDYGPHWGYRFIQSSSLGGRHFLWTADATFRLGRGEAKYNYFKLLDAETGELVQADSRDTYQQDCEGFAMIDGERYVAAVTPIGEWLHEYKGGGTNSLMQLRYCKIRVDRGAEKDPLEGYALNERCFGVLG